MSEVSTHDVSAIRDASSTVGKAATGATSTLSSTVSEIKGIGVAWGADEAGAAFAGVYLDPAEEAMTAVVQVGHQLDRISEILTGAADGHEETEQVNAETSNAMLREDRPVHTPTRSA